MKEGCANKNQNNHKTHIVRHLYTTCTSMYVHRPGIPNWNWLEGWSLPTTVLASRMSISRPRSMGTRRNGGMKVVVAVVAAVVVVVAVVVAGAGGAGGGDDGTGGCVGVGAGCIGSRCSEPQLSPPGGTATPTVGGDNGTGAGMGDGNELSQNVVVLSASPSSDWAC